MRPLAILAAVLWMSTAANGAEIEILLRQSNQVATVEIAGAQQLRTGLLEVLVVVPVPDHSQQVDVAEGDLDLDEGFAQALHRSV